MEDVIMGKLLENLKNYFENTPKDIIDRELNALDYLNEVGPDVQEYAEQIREYLCSNIQIERFNIPKYNGEHYVDSSNSNYYLAA